MRYAYAPGSDAAHSAAVAAVSDSAAPARPVILRAAQPYDLATPGTPLGIRAVAVAAERGGVWTHRATLALAEDTDGAIVASLCLRLRGDLPGQVRRAWVGYARAGEGGWEPTGAALLDHGDHEHPLRPIGVEPLKAMLRGEVYVPPAPPPPAFKVPCQGCGRWVSITGAGAIYKSHKCKTTAGTEGRS